MGGMHIPDFLLFIHKKLSLIHMKFIWLVESRHAFLVLLFGFFPFLFFSLPEIDCTSINTFPEV